MSTATNRTQLISPVDHIAFNALVGARVKAARTGLGWSLRDLAAKAEVSSSAICRIERGKASPQILTLALIAEATGREPGWFFGEGWPR
jgi:transcriptional regulator with XRE-family HTH domain